jgi:hypothetical protein
MVRLSSREIISSEGSAIAKKNQSIEMFLKVPKCEILISWILIHFLQMGEIQAILFLLPHAPSTLANCYHMRSVR